jgi:two-component system, NarL family, sensor histidine kinase DesK
MTTAVAVSPVDQVLTTVRRSRMLLIALHVPMIAFLTALGATGLGFMPTGDPVFALPAGLLIGTLQIRHSLAFVAGRRPRYSVQSFSAIVLLAVVPTLEVSLAWYPSLWFVGASGAMLARQRLRPLILIAVAAAWVALALRDQVGHPVTFNEVASLMTYVFVLGLMGSAALYGSARLVRVVDELFDARAQLAQLAIGDERSRVARDLHDVLGQSLTAISLKGELAVRLLKSDAQRARQEVGDLTTLAREALVDVRAVALDQRTASLASEVSSSTALLRTAGIDAHVHVAVDHLCPTTESLLGWAVREGVANVLRHSAASRCAIRIFRSDGGIRLEIANDGAVGPIGHGSGLAGLATRAEAVHGSSHTERTDDGWFRLHMTVPDRQP